MTRLRPLPRILPLVAWLALSDRAPGHAGEDHHGERIGPRDWGELWMSWGLEPGVLIPIALTAFLYGLGLRCLWRGGHVGRGVTVGQALCFAGGWIALAVALVSPLHPWGSVLFSAHMTQHEVLMLVAAPLLVLGRPVVASLKALPSGWAREVNRWTRASWWRAVWGFVTNPFAAWAIHAVVLWGWHVPALFQATLEHEWVHALQHASFLLSALLFWWAVLHARPRVVGYGVAVLSMFTTAAHSGFLGALITLARSVWYPAYARTTASWGLTPLEDQQLGGLIMWIPACSVYVIAGLALFAGWLRETERLQTACEEGRP